MARLLFQSRTHKWRHIQGGEGQGFFDDSAKAFGLKSVPVGMSQIACRHLWTTPNLVMEISHLLL